MQSQQNTVLSVTKKEKRIHHGVVLISIHLPIIFFPNEAKYKNIPITMPQLYPQNHQK